MIANLMLLTLIIGVLLIAVMLVMRSTGSYRDEDEDDWF
jgi:hypothetical protein